MTDLDRLLIDTSAWIDFFSGRCEELSYCVRTAVNENRVFTSALIVAELVSGAQTEEEAEDLEDKFSAFQRCSEDMTTFIEAAHVRRRFFARGQLQKKPGLADCFIAVIAKRNRCSLLTCDSHFMNLRQYIDIHIFFFDRKSGRIRELS